MRPVFSIISNVICPEPGWNRLLERCESPIERELAGAFRLHWPFAQPAFGPCTPEAVRAAEEKGARLVYCQYPIERFRADFLIAEPRAVPLVVECDGWAYHQGDPSTWVRDAERDKVMHAAGYETLRFTGSRIMGHLDEVLEIIERALRGEFRDAA